MRIFILTFFSTILAKLRGHKASPSNTTAKADESTRFNSDIYQYEDELDDKQYQMYSEDEIQYDEDLEYSDDDYETDVNEDVYYDNYDPSTDDDDTYSAAD